MELNYRRIRLLWIFAFTAMILWRMIEKINIVLSTSEINVSLVGYISGGIFGSLTLFASLYVFSYKRHGVRLLVCIMIMLSFSLIHKFMSFKLSCWTVMEITTHFFFGFACYRLLLLNTLLYCKIKPEVDVNKGFDLSPCPELTVPTKQKQPNLQLEN